MGKDAAAKHMTSGEQACGSNGAISDDSHRDTKISTKELITLAHVNAVISLSTPVWDSFHCTFSLNDQKIGSRSSPV